MVKRILVTGASGNLGRATVGKLLDSGYEVMAVDLHSPKHNPFDKFPGFSFYHCDLQNEEETRFLVDELIKKHHSISGALLLAGGFAMGDLESTNFSEIREMTDLNFAAVYNIARILHPHMIKNGYGRMVFVGARPALDPAAGKSMIAYALSKSLLFSFSQILNAASKEKNVVSSVIVPSVIDTPQNRQSMPNAAFEKWVTPESIASILEFICSDKAEPLREPVYKIYGDS